MKLVLAVAALAAAGLVGPATADPGVGGPCHVYWRPPVADHNIRGVPGFPGQPYLYCDY